MADIVEIGGIKFEFKTTQINPGEILIGASLEDSYRLAREAGFGDLWLKFYYEIFGDDGG